MVAVLCFLACLTVVAALGANRAANGWRTQLLDSATVIVRPSANETADAAAERAAAALSAIRPGVTEAAVLEKEKAEALLAPWLGSGDVLDDLPVPRLVSVDLDPKAPASVAAMEKALKANDVDATIDDHSLWLKDVLHAGVMARFAALGAAATAAVIAFATRAGLAARRDLVNVLHLAGAEDSFIAGLFQARFARMAALAGLLGAGAAAMIAAGLRLFGGGAGLTPVLPLAWSDLLVLPICPVIAGLVAAAAARYTATALLKEMM